MTTKTDMGIIAVVLLLAASGCEGMLTESLGASKQQLETEMQLQSPQSQCFCLPVPGQRGGLISMNQAPSPPGAREKCVFCVPFQQYEPQQDNQDGSPDQEYPRQFVPKLFPPRSPSNNILDPTDLPGWPQRPASSDAFGPYPVYFQGHPRYPYGPQPGPLYSPGQPGSPYGRQPESLYDPQSGSPFGPQQGGPQNGIVKPGFAMPQYGPRSSDEPLNISPEFLSNAIIPSFVEPQPPQQQRDFEQLHPLNTEPNGLQPSPPFGAFNSFPQSHSSYSQPLGVNPRSPYPLPGPAGPFVPLSPPQLLPNGFRPGPSCPPFLQILCGSHLRLNYQPMCAPGTSSSPLQLCRSVNGVCPPMTVCVPCPPGNPIAGPVRPRGNPETSLNQLANLINNRLNGAPSPNQSVMDNQFMSTRPQPSKPTRNPAVMRSLSH